MILLWNKLKIYSLRAWYTMFVIYTNTTFFKCYIYDSVQNLFHLHATGQKQNLPPNLIVFMSTLLVFTKYLHEFTSTCVSILIQNYSLMMLLCYMCFLNNWNKIRLEEFWNFSTLNEKTRQATKQTNNGKKTLLNSKLNAQKKRFYIWEYLS